MASQLPTLNMGPPLALVDRIPPLAQPQPVFVNFAQAQNPPPPPPQFLPPFTIANPDPQPDLKSSASVTCKLGKDLYERHDDSMLSKIPKDVLKSFESRKCQYVVCNHNIKPGEPSFFLLRFSKDLEGKEMPVFQFYFTPSSGDINIKEDEKFDEYVHMIKNFDMLYQGKATRSKTEYTFFSLMYGNMTNANTFQHLAKNLQAFLQFNNMNKLQDMKNRGFTGTACWHYIKDKKWFRGIEFTGEGTEGEVAMRHFFHGDKNKDMNWDNVK